MDSRNSVSKRKLMKWVASRNMPFKILVAYVQVLSTLSSNFRLVYPRVVLDLFSLIGLLDVFDVFGIASSYRCLFRADYFTLLYVRLLGPFALMAAIAAGRAPGTPPIRPSKDSSPMATNPSTASAGNAPIATMSPNAMGKS